MGFGVESLGCRVQPVAVVAVIGHWLYAAGCRSFGVGFRVWGAGLRVEQLWLRVRVCGRACGVIAQPECVQPAALKSQI